MVKVTNWDKTEVNALAQFQVLTIKVTSNT